MEKNEKLLKSSKLICYVENDNNGTAVLKDKNEKEIPYSKKDSIKEIKSLCSNISKAINNAYNEKADRKNKEYDTVWILVGEKDNTKKIIQVGQSSSRKNMLKEIDKNAEWIIGIVSNKEKNKNKFMTYRSVVKKYKCLCFYEVDIEKYLVDDKKFHNWFKKIPNEFYSKIYRKIMAGYCEGKIAAEFGAGDGETGGIWYRSDGIEGIVFDMYHEKYVKPKKEAEENADDKGGKL